MKDLRGRNALVTGAAGGLGGYIARALAAEGVNLVLSDLPGADLEPLAGELTAKGVLTIKMTAKKGGLAGALIVREHQDLLFISQNGMVQRTRAGGISQMGRATQGVKVMNIKDDDRVSAVALVVESTADAGDVATEAEQVAAAAADGAAPAPATPDK